MKKIINLNTLLASTLAVSLPNSSYADVLITEYIEGSSNNKAIEISNLGDAAIDLAQQQYKLSLYHNGSTSATSTESLTGTLQARQSLVLYNNSAASQFKLPAPDGMASSVANFNGDDTLVLYKGTDVVDSFGKLGNDPGSAWTYGSFSSKDKTLRRLSSITTGDAVHNDSFPGSNHGWAVFSQNTSDGLGCPTEHACSALSPVLITEYVEGSSNNKAIEITNISASDIDMNSQGYKLELYSNGNTSASQTEYLNGTLAAGKSFVVYNASAAQDFVFAAPNGVASTVTYFNGDDAIVLKKGNTVIDSIGRVGQDPGSAWTDSSNPEFSTANKTLRRKASVVSGDTNTGNAFPHDAGEWLVLAKDTSDGLGCDGEAACTTKTPEEPVDTICVNCPEITKVADASTFSKSTYYANAYSASASEFRSTLNGIISANQKQLTYSEVWSLLTYSDEDPNNSDNVIEIYSGNSIAKFSNGSGTQSSDPDAWNREHIWAKSHGFPDRAQMAYTDAHHLRPADISINSARGNYDFAEGGVPLAEAPANMYDETLKTWEPRDAVKGDVARMMFYMDLRYEGAAADNTPDLILVDNIGTENGTAEFGKLCTLYQWHLNDPVDATETRRNTAVYEYQGNRNPFIDHPEWLATLYASKCGN